MDKIILVTPNIQLKSKALDYRQEHFDFGETVINGSELFDKTPCYEEWLEKIIGIADLRYELNDFLKDLGNCGYSVRPSERNKGYASEILKQICALAKEHGLDNLQLSVERENTASIKTILRNGGCYSRSFKFGNEEADVYSINLSSGKQFELAKEPQASSHFMKKKSNVKER